LVPGGVVELEDIVVAGSASESAVLDERSSGVSLDGLPDEASMVALALMEREVAAREGSPSRIFGRRNGSLVWKLPLRS
jgi:hypothetical protein